VEEAGAVSRVAQVPVGCPDDELDALGALLHGSTPRRAQI
jgi:hypothetical protein